MQKSASYRLASHAIGTNRSAYTPVQLNQLSTFIKIMEYMSCGKVTVCFALLESRRTAGDTAVLVEWDDPAEFAEAIEQLLDDAQRMCEMGNAARERSLRLYWGISQEALIRTLKSCSLVSDHTAPWSSRWMRFFRFPPRERRRAFLGGPG
jgi:glycosyltransferase involved in cell wall biosynthesis